MIKRFCPRCKSIVKEQVKELDDCRIFDLDSGKELKATLVRCPSCHVLFSIKEEVVRKNVPEWAMR